MMYLTVRLDTENNRFYIKNNNGNSELRFNKLSPKLYELNFLHISSKSNTTEIEEELLYSACLFAQKEGIKIIPACDKVIKYLSQHKEFMCITYQEPASA